MGARLSIAIGVITCDRPIWLRRLLLSLARQALSDSHAHLRVIVMDNGRGGESRHVVESLRRDTGLNIQYLVEPEPGIPFARNACVRAALDDDALVFIDDDEWAPEGWLDSLLRTWRDTGADIVMGPVEGVLPDDAPRWARDSRVFDKDLGKETGEPIRTAFTYNTLVSRRVLQALGPTFDAAFRYTGSSDHHYFRKAARAGFKAVWCREALVYEDVPSERISLAWLARRGYRIGAGGARAARMLESPGLALLRITTRAGGNFGYGLLHLARLSRRPSREAPRALRRFMISAGFVFGLFGLHHEEYKSRAESPGDESRETPGVRVRAARQ